MWWRRIRLRPDAGPAPRSRWCAVQGATLLALAVVDTRRKRQPQARRLPADPATLGHRRRFGGDRLHLRRRPLPRHAGRHPAGQVARSSSRRFIWKGDAVGQAFKDALIEAADRGVQVYVVFDEFANLVVPRRVLRFPPNIHVRRHPLSPAAGRSLRNSGRDHRKLLVVDDAVAFVGGYNIGSLYATDWRDTHARLTGDIVWDAAERVHRLLEPVAGAAPARPARRRRAHLAVRHPDPPQHPAATWSTRSGRCTSTPSTGPRSTST